MERTINLSALAKRFRSQKQHLKLAGLIEKAVNLASLHSDMMMAAESLKALKTQLALPTDPNDHQKLITESSLLNNAIVLYARASKSKSKIRAGFDLRAKFDERQRAVHQELCDLRDDAIAHFGNGGCYLGEWQAETAILQFKGDEGRAAVVTRRQTIDRSLVKRACEQIDTARTLLRVLFQQTLELVTKDIDKAVEIHPEFYRELDEHPLNLELFLQSYEAASAVRASNVPGRYARGSVVGR